MKAIRIQQYGSANSMSIEEVPTPGCGESDVLIRVGASGVNPIDWKIRAGNLAGVFPLPMPLTLGWEAAGTVVKMGARVTEFQPGDKVYALVPYLRGGTYAEYVAVDAFHVAPMPASLSFATAATLPMTALAAWNAIEASAVKPGRIVLIHGGAGGVGSLAIQMAKRLGGFVIATAAADDFELVRTLGADLVVDYRRPDRLPTVGRVDVVIDTQGGVVQDASWPLLREGGLLIALTQPPSQDAARRLGVRAIQLMALPDGELLRTIGALVDGSMLRAIEANEYPLALASEVHARGERGQLRGRTALRIAP